MSIVQLGGEYRLINETIVQIGNKIDKAFLERDESELCNCLCIAQSLRDDCTTPDEAAVLEYFIGNAWADWIESVR